MVSFDPLCGIAARKETMKLAGLRLRVIWTLPFFSYLNLVRSKEKKSKSTKEAGRRAGAEQSEKKSEYLHTR